VPHFAYIARCADDSLYVGTCVDLAAREALHNAGKGSKYTRSRLPVEFVYHEEHPTLSAVRKREAAMKKLSRAEKLHLLKNGSASSTR
jgi:predicted GIY-YIG superfamily endonuclease